jgi:hypothetical protein
MAFRAMDAGCDGVDCDSSDTECDAAVTAVGLYLAKHRHRAAVLCLRRPRPPTHRPTRTTRTATATTSAAGKSWPKIHASGAATPEGATSPLARGADATALVRKAVEWAKRHPFHALPTQPHPPAENSNPYGRQPREAGRMTVDALADELGVPPGDVRVLLSWLDPDNGGLHPDGTLLNEYAATIRDQLDHLCERTVADYWWPGHNPDAGKGATKTR